MNGLIVLQFTLVVLRLFSRSIYFLSQGMMLAICIKGMGALVLDFGSVVLISLLHFVS